LDLDVQQSLLRTLYHKSVIALENGLIRKGTTGKIPFSPTLKELVQQQWKTIQKLENKKKDKILGPIRSQTLILAPRRLVENHLTDRHFVDPQ
jgi:hypothetical protein